MAKMLIKAHIVAIVTLVLATNTVVQAHTRFKWNILQDFLCSYIWTKGDGTFETARISEMRTLVGSSSVDVGTCPSASCSNIQYLHNYDCGNHGYVCPLTETIVADLGPLGTHKYEYVTKCTCCEDKGLKVKVRTVDSKSGEPLSEMMVFVNNDAIGKTDGNGIIEATVEHTEGNLVFRSEDNRDKLYMHAVIVVDAQINSPAPVDATLNMIKKAEPVTFNPRTEQTLSLSDDPLNPNAGKSYIVIPKNSFRGRRWWDRPNKINAIVTFIDTNMGPEAPIPGRFLTRLGDNTYANLVSDGIVAFEFTDNSGNVVRPNKPIEFHVPIDMRLWKLDEDTGTWEAYGYQSERRKRQVTLTTTYMADIENAVWINIDKIPDVPRCYFKARIFNATSGDEIASSQTATFKPAITAYTNASQRLRLYPSAISSPSDTCFDVPCPVVSHPNDTLTGFINMSSTELLSIGGLSVAYRTFLTPRTLAGYIPQIQTRHGAVQYAIAPNGLDVFANFVSHGNGPFYPNQNACENSPVNRPAFHFFKPDLPSYVVGPSDADLCIARIVFRNESGSFYNYTSNMTNSLPNITAISTWTNTNGEGQFYTDTVQLQESTWNASDYFVYACVRYRCSEADQPTTVYLDIHIPDVVHYFNTTDENGNTVERNRTGPAFSCHGACQGNVCYQNINGTTIDGTFNAPDGVDSGPDFYDSQNTDCGDRTSTEAFAFEFWCYVSGRGYGYDEAMRRIEK